MNISRNILFNKEFISRNILFNKEFNSLIKIFGLIIGCLSSYIYYIYKIEELNFNYLMPIFLLFLFLILLNLYNLKNHYNDKIYFLNSRISSILIVYIAFIRYATSNGYYKLILYETISFKNEYNFLKYFYIMIDCFFTYILIGTVIGSCFRSLYQEYTWINYLLYIIIISIISFLIFKKEKIKKIDNFKKEIIDTYNIIETKFEDLIFTFENKSDLVKLEIGNIYINFKSGLLYFTDNINNKVINVPYLNVKNYQINNENKNLSEINLSDIKVIEMIAI